MFGKLNDSEIEQLLKQQLIGRLGCHTDITYIIPVSYAYAAPYVYVYTQNGMKVDMMKKNPNVCFQVDETRNLTCWKSVVCWGVFEELTEESSKRNALEILQARVLPILSSETMHISREWPFSASKDEKMPGMFFRIKLTTKTGRYEKIAGEEFYAT
jgi:nitroimidazol reductase NimA-like FMN-containing flavoprotein (pyridoxamine 5'-phosphate oxidase superfamily)